MEETKSRKGKQNQKFSFRSAIIVISVLILATLIGEQIFIAVQKQQTSNFEISSESLKRAIAQSTNDYCVTKDDAQKITRLDLSSGVIIENFEGFQYFSSVETIIMKDSIIHSFEGIDKLKNLKELKIEATQTDDITDIKNLNLQRLTLKACELDKTIDLGSMPELVSLDLSNNSIEKLNGVFPKLVTINLSENRIKSITDINLSDNLEELTLNGNPISTLDGIENCMNIRSLKITGTDIEDISIVKTMESLNALYIDKDLMDDSLEYLYDNFRNGDNNRKKEYISRLYGIGD